MLKKNALPVVDKYNTLIVKYHEQDLRDVVRDFPTNLVKDILHENAAVKISVGDENKYELEGYELYSGDEYSSGFTFVGKLVEAIRSVRENHVASFDDDICLECKSDWPCKTIQDIELVFDLGSWREGYEAPKSVTIEEVDLNEYREEIRTKIKEYEAFLNSTSF